LPVALAAIIDLLSVSVESNVTTLVNIIGYQIDLDQADAQPAAIEYARRLAQRGVPVASAARLPGRIKRLHLDAAGIGAGAKHDRAPAG
jgi:hypothetical protein